MYLAFLDEAGHTSPKGFTVCGLTAIKADKAATLSHSIDIYRRTILKIDDDVLLKSAAQHRVKGTSAQDHLEVKKKIISLGASQDIVFMGYAYFNQAAYTFDPDRNRLFGFNVLISRFDKFLKQTKSHGSVTVDRLNLSKKSDQGYKNSFEYLQEKFQKGNHHKNRNNWIPHERVLSFPTSCEGTSHFSSVNDILTGSLLYLINGDNPEARKALQEQLTSVMWKGKSGEFRDHGLSLLPKNRDALDADVAVEYDVLRSFLNSPQ